MFPKSFVDNYMANLTSAFSSGFQGKDHVSGARVDYSDIQTFSTFSLYPEQRRWFNEIYLSNKDQKIKMLLGARGYGKSDVISVFGLAWYIYNYPDKTALLVTTTSSLGERIIETIGSILKSLGVKGSYQKRKIRTSYNLSLKKKQANLELITTGGNPRGHHVNRIIIDDPVQSIHEYSNKFKRRAMSFFEEAKSLGEKLKNKDNENDFQIAVIGQPVSEDDLYSFLRQEIYTIESWYGTITELDEDKEEFLKTSGERTWGKNYEGKFEPNKDSLFTIDEQTHFFDDHCPKNSHILNNTVMFIDPSYSGNRDGTAVVVGKPLNGILYCKGYLFKHFRELLESVENLVLSYNVRHIQIDATNDKMQGLSSMIADLGIIKGRISPGDVIGFVENENKEQKISNNLYYVLGNNKIKFANKYENDRFITQIKTYSGKESEYDDAPDVLACMIRMLRFKGFI